ncbi:uncharacterized protein METZ01_LOCUS389795 [marine metagenome]|uniref:Uncharacterized protein n=1 Tax=marine metagenome TaxID=408172 RepID=A0A382UTC1_9ZZZZ
MPKAQVNKPMSKSSDYYYTPLIEKTCGRVIPHVQYQKRTVKHDVIRCGQPSKRELGSFFQCSECRGV